MTFLLTTKVYPKDGFNSYLNRVTAGQYFSGRLNTDEWDAATVAEQEAALIQGFRALDELDLDLLWNDDGTLSDSYTDDQKADILEKLQMAQAEQSLHELKHDLDSPQTVSRVSIGGNVALSFGRLDKPPSRFAPRALAILRPFIRAKTVSRYR